MAEKINWAMSVNVAGGPALSKSGILDVEGYDKFDIIIPKGKETTIEVQLGDAKRTELVFIYSSEFKGLTYTVNGGKSIELNAPLILIGKGATSLLGDKQNTFKFKNEADSDASIVILIGRNVIPTA